MAIKEKKLIRSLFLAVAMMLVSTTLASAQTWYYNHNGSTMKLVWDEAGDGFTVYYQNPKPGLPDYVERGTILLQGTAPANGSLYATAYVFSGKCGTGEYEVSGEFDPGQDDYDFTLKGPAPVLNQQTCEDIGLSWQSPNANLRFKYLHD